MTRIERAIQLLKEASIENPRADQPPCPSDIEHAQKALGIVFPPSFLRYLQLAGEYSLPFWETYWVSPTERDDIVEMNRQEHEEAESPLPPNLITFHNDGMGNQVCFECSARDSGGEYRIVFWDHELTPEENGEDLKVVAPNFAEWLIEQVKIASS